MVMGGHSRKAARTQHLARIVPRWAIVALLLIPLIAGCAPALEQAKPVTVHFAYPRSDTDTYTSLATEFKKSAPYITLDLRAIGGNERNQDPFNHFDPGDADCFSNSNLSLDSLVADGKIRSLDPWIENDKTYDAPDFYPGTAALLSGDGKTWGVPAGIDPWVLFYNKDLFDKAGVAYPAAGWTWEDFLQAAQKTTNPDTSIYGFVTCNIVDPALLIYQHGGSLVDNLDNPTRATFDNRKTVEAMEWWAALMTDKKVAPNSQTIRSTFRQAEGGIYLGKVAMWFGQMSERGGLTLPQDLTWTFHWGMSPLPVNVQPATIATAEGYFISAKTSAGDACWKWLSFLSHQPPARLAPARKSVLQADAYTQLAGKEVANTARSVLPQAIMLKSLTTGPFQKIVGGPFQQAFDAIMGGKVTVQDAMNQAQAASQ